MEVKAQKIGNSIMITIPKKIAREAGIKPGVGVEVERLSTYLKISSKPQKSGKLSDFVGTVTIPNLKIEPKKEIKFIKESGYERINKWLKETKK